MALLSGCNSSDNNQKLNNQLDSQTSNTVNTIPNAETVYGEIEITDEIRGEFYDFAREQRWDFLPWFSLGKTPTELEDYIDWVMIQAQIWSGYDEPNRELTPSKLTKDYVRELIKQHFDVKVLMPEISGYVDRFAFDGNDFTVQIGGWANLPVYELTELSLESLDNKDIYTAKLLQYNHIEGLTDIPRDIIISENADKSEVYPFCWIKVQFYIDEPNNNIVYVSVDGGSVY